MTTDKYPLSPKYTKRQIDEADELYDEVPLREVADRTGIPYGTLEMWRHHGYIGTETDHYAGVAWERSPYTDEDVRRADQLYDRMYIPAVSDVLGIPEKTLYDWQSKGWISTEVDHPHPNRQPKKNERRARRAAHLVHEQDYTQKEVAEKMGISEGLVSRLMKMYRQGVYVSTELE